MHTVSIMMHSQLSYLKAPIIANVIIIIQESLPGDRYTYRRCMWTITKQRLACKLFWKVHKLQIFELILLSQIGTLLMYASPQHRNLYFFRVNPQIANLHTSFVFQSLVANPKFFHYNTAKMKHLFSKVWSLFGYCKAKSFKIWPQACLFCTQLNQSISSLHICIVDFGLLPDGGGGGVGGGGVGTNIHKLGLTSMVVSLVQCLSLYLTFAGKFALFSSAFHPI